MRTTENIIKDLRARATAGEDVRQQVIAHDTIARLREELASFDHREQPERAAGLKQHVGLYLRMVDEDVDDSAPDDDVKVKAPRPPK